jgi:hypothetical protein
MMTRNLLGILIKIFVITLLQQCKLKGVYFVRNGEDEVVGD